MRPIRSADHAAVRELNQAAVPAVTPMPPDEFDFYRSIAERFVVADDSGDVDGFLILIGPGVDAYQSANYRWFSERYDDFCYVDRIVVAERCRRSGLGRRFYEHAVDVAAGRPVLAEVNLRPRNDGSLAFHESMGFTQVGTQDVEGGTKTVAMLART